MVAMLVAAFFAGSVSAASEPEVSRFNETVTTVRRQALGYHLVLPADHEGPLPVLVIPAHPTDLDPARMRLPRTAQPWAVLRLDGPNAFYGSRSEKAYNRMRRRGWFQPAIRQAQAAALAHALERYPLDPNHLVCMGMSASGNACWDLAIHWPGVFAGVWPISAGYNPVSNPTCWENLDQQRLYILHGAADPLIQDAWVEAAARGAQEAGATVEYHRIDGAGHGTFADPVWQAGFQWAAALNPPHANLTDRCGD